MNNLDKLVMLFKERENPFNINITIGKVIALSPIRVTYGDKIILESKHLVISDSLLNGYSGEYTDDNGITVETKTITVKNELQVGNKVILIPDVTMKKWYLLDKVVTL